MPPPKKAAPPAKTGGGASKTGAKTGAKPAATKAAPAKAAAAAPAKAAAPVEPPPPEQRVALKAFVGLVVEDGDGSIKNSKWWPLCVDEKDVVGRFMSMRDVNVINGLDQSAMDPERIRLALLGALRYGKPLVFDQMEADLYESMKELMDKIMPGLLDKVLDKSIMQTENIMKLVKDSDDEQYKSHYAYGPSEDFKFIVLSNHTRPTGFTSKMRLIIVE